jgi:hypothetical protein
MLQVMLSLDQLLCRRQRPDCPELEDASGELACRIARRVNAKLSLIILGLHRVADYHRAATVMRNDEPAGLISVQPAKFVAAARSSARVRPAGHSLNPKTCAALEGRR